MSQATHAVYDTEQELVPWWPDAARRLGIGRSLMADLIKDGEIASVKIRSRRLVEVAEIRRYVERLKTTTAVG